MALQDRISREENENLVGHRVEVVVTAEEGRKHAETHRLSGRAEDSRLVHFEVPAGSAIPRPGDVVSLEITQAASFHLVADSIDGAQLRIRRTSAGDAWDRAEAASCEIPAPSGKTSISLGLPSLRVATLPIYDTNDGLR